LISLSTEWRWDRLLSEPPKGLASVNKK